MQIVHAEGKKLAHYWNDINATLNHNIMKKTINVLVIEDDEYYNNILSNAILQSVNSLLFKGNHQVVLRSFTDANEYIRKLKSKELECSGTIVFVDYYLGDGIDASHVIKALKEYSSDTMVVLLSQSKEVKEKSSLIPYDYFVVKDNFAPALCSLYLKQFIENKFSVTLD
jgi:CheY-like chemotaxis protein